MMKNTSYNFTEELKLIKKEKEALLNMSLTSEDISRRRILTHLEKLIKECNKEETRLKSLTKELKQLGVTDADFEDNARRHSQFIKEKVFEIKNNRELLNERRQEVQLVLQKFQRKNNNTNFEEVLKTLKEKEDIIDQMVRKGEYNPEQAIPIESGILKDRELLKSMELSQPTRMGTPQLSQKDEIIEMHSVRMDSPLLSRRFF